MSSGVRNLAWVLPSNRGNDVFAKLTVLANEVGLQVEDRRGEREGRAAVSGKVLTIVDHPAAVAHADPKSWFIVLPLSSRDLAAELLRNQPQLSQAEAITEASITLSFVNYLMLHGAVVVGDVEKANRELFTNGAAPTAKMLDGDGRNVLGHYASLPVAEGATAVWRAEDFHYTKGLERTGGAPSIDLTGRGRILVYGPNVTLTPGVWKIEAEFDLDVEGDPVGLRFDWGHGEDCTTSRFKPKSTGRYRIELTRTWLENQTAEFRIWVEHGMLHGQLNFSGAHIHRVG